MISPSDRREAVVLITDIRGQSKNSWDIRGQSKNSKYK